MAHDLSGPRIGALNKIFAACALSGLWPPALVNLAMRKCARPLAVARSHGWPRKQQSRHRRWWQARQQRPRRASPPLVCPLLRRLRRWRAIAGLGHTTHVTPFVTPAELIEHAKPVEINQEDSHAITTLFPANDVGRCRVLLGAGRRHTPHCHARRYVRRTLRLSACGKSRPDRLGDAARNAVSQHVPSAGIPSTAASGKACGHRLPSIRPMASTSRIARVLAAHRSTAFARPHAPQRTNSPRCPSPVRYLALCILP